MHSSRPLIGITCSRMIGGAWSVYSRSHFMDYTFSAYSRAVLACNGSPVLIPAAQNPDSLKTILGRLQGLILSGGPDVHPRYYHEPPSPQLGDIDETLDKMELEAARLANNIDLPILAICRGIQILNVALGGSLYQDILSQAKTNIHHAPNADKKTHTHEVIIEPDTRLSQILNRNKIWVNSKHHQAVKDLAPSLKLAARADDGIIEAVENYSKRFMLGVQWHPEGTWEDDACAKQLFDAFIQAAHETTPGYTS
jgi:putative glutamine amidotransferase